jgi:hypothetical protein
MSPRPTRAGNGERRTPEPPKAAVENRWWVEQADAAAKERRQASVVQTALPPHALPGAKLYLVGKDFDQEAARARLTDSNLNFLRAANPAANEWAYLATAKERSPEELVRKTQHALRLPAGARGVLIDSGSSLRAIVTGQPVGERIIEITLADDSCFDAWVHGDWVCEKVFASRERALRESGSLIATYLRNDE